MKIKRKFVLYFLILALMFPLIPIVYAESDVPLVTKDELKAMLQDKDLVILDVRRGKDWKSSEFKIQGATYADPGEYQSWAERYPKNKKLVLYCA